MENIYQIKEYETFPIVEEVGIRDNILHYYYDTSCFVNPQVNVTRIIIHNDREYIIGIEFFYDDITTGVFKGESDDAYCIDTCSSVNIQLGRDEKILFAFGTYTADTDYITSLQFYLSSGNIKGFESKLTKDTSKVVKKFKFWKKDKDLIGLNLAFGKYLSYITPIFREEVLVKVNDNLVISIQMGKKLNDMNSFLIDLAREISLIRLYHDKSLVKSIEIIYTDEEKLKLGSLFYGDADDIVCSELQLVKDETITKVIIRAGDLIDNISLFTNKNKFITAGGSGGRPFMFNLEEMGSAFNLNLKLAQLEVGLANSLHYLQLYFSC